MNRFRIAAGLVIVMALAWLPAGAGSGDRDLSFGSRGVSTLVGFGGEDHTDAMAVRPDGGILVATTHYRWDGKRSRDDIGVVRYRASGGLDRRFSGDGKTTLDLGHIERPEAIAALSDGGVAIAGTTYDDAGKNGRLLVARWTKTGARAAGFGTKGVAMPFNTDFSKSVQWAAGVAATPDGKIVVGGTIWKTLDPPDVDARVPTNPRCVAQIVLTRLDTTGAVDQTFGIGGYASTPIDGSCTTMAALARLSDGRLVVAGTRTGEVQRGLVVARFSADGLPDPTFGVAGRSIIPWNSGWAAARAMTVQRDGKVIVGGVVSGEAFFDLSDHLTLWRVNADGAIDSTFGTGGVARTPYDGRFAGLVVQRSGRIVVAGEEGSWCFLPPCFWDPLAFALKSNGRLDSSYGDRGKVAFPDRYDDATAIALQGDHPVIGGDWHALCLTCFVFFIFFYTDRMPADIALVRLH